MAAPSSMVKPREGEMSVMRLPRMAMMRQPQIASPNTSVTAPYASIHTGTSELSPATVPVIHVW